MKNSLSAIVLGLLLLFFCSITAPASAFQRCMLCGMDVDQSETAFYAKMKNGKIVPLCSMQCVHIFEMNAGEKPVSIRTEKYPTARLMDAKAAYYLCESRLIPRGSMAPYIAAFASKEQAEGYQKKYGGRILSFDQAMAFVEQSLKK